jgi:hypothetical protein
MPRAPRAVSRLGRTGLAALAACGFVFILALAMAIRAGPGTIMAARATP